MEQEMMQIRHELKELSDKVNHIMQKMDGSMAQRMYGMRSNQSPGNAGYNGGSNNGGSYNQREPWQGGYPQQMPPPMPMQGMQQYPMQYPQQDMMQQMNPLWFM